MNIFHPLARVTCCLLLIKFSLAKCDTNSSTTASASPTKELLVSFHPASFDDLKEEESKVVHISYINSTIDEEKFSSLRFDIKSTDESIASVTQSLNQFQDRTSSGNFSIILTANTLGKASLVWRLYDWPLNRTIDTGSFAISVSRRSDKYRIQVIFTIFVAILVTINNINMGCFIDLGTIKRVLEKPVAPAIGFFCQFLFMPIASFIVGLIFFPSNLPWRIGLFTLGCCPGGTGSNFWTLLFDGDVDLSITMTFISTLAAMAMMPLWIFSLGRLLFQQADIQIPYVNLLTSLLFLALSLAIGIVIQKVSPSCAKFLKRYLKTFTAIVILIVIVGGTWVSYHIFALLTVKAVLAGLTVALGGYLFGAIVAIAFKLPLSQIIAVSIETALQNPGIAFVLLQMSLKHPDSDLATVPIVGQLFMTGIPLWIGFCIYFILTRLRVFEPISQVEAKDTSNDENDEGKNNQNDSDDEGDSSPSEDETGPGDQIKSPHPQIIILEPGKHTNSK